MMHRVLTQLLFLFTLLLSNINWAQVDSNQSVQTEAPSTTEPSEQEKTVAPFSSPHATITYHLKNLQRKNMRPEEAAKALYPVFDDQDKMSRLAKQLIQIYDGEGFLIDAKRLPENPNYQDTLSGKHIYEPYDKMPAIYLKKYEDKWLYSEETVKALTSIHKEVYPFGTDKLLNMVSNQGSSEFMGLYIWQLVGILILILLAYIVHKVFTVIVERIIVILVKRFGRLRLATENIRRVAKPFSLLVVFLFLSILVPVLQLPIGMAHWAILLIRSLTVPIFCIIVLYRLIDVAAVYMYRLAERTKSTLDDQLVPLVKKALKTFVVLIGFVFILQNLEFDVTALIAGLSIGGLAFALAAQDTIKNFFGSLMIFVDKPFQIGDWIVTNDIDGDIEEVGFRSTRIRTFHNSLIYIPNGKLADMTIDNMGERTYRRYKTYIAVTYDTPPHVLDAFVEGLKKIVENHPNTRKDYFNVYVNTFGASSIDILFYIFFAVPTWPGELKARHEVNLEIIHLAEKMGVRFAFPTQTLHVEDFPEKQSMTPQDYLQPGDLQAVLREMDQQKKP